MIDTATPTTFTVPTLAKYWRCHVDRIYQLIREGQLRAFLLKKEYDQRPRYRISMEAVREFEHASLAVDPPAPKASRKRAGSKPRKRHFADA